jgi:hypothetical protein
MKIDRKIVVTAIPIIMVNIAAIVAQYQFIRSHLPTWGVAGDLLLAMAIESIAIQLSYFAHLAMVAGDSFAKLRLSAIGFAAIVALANGSHYLSNGHITFASVAVATCSISSPILWGIYSRRQSRDKLLEQGLIEGHAVRLGSVRWFYWPIRTFKVYRSATWSGENNPTKAINDWQDSQIEVIPDVPEITISNAQTQADAIRLAFKALGNDAKTGDIVRWLAENPDHKWTVSPTRVRQIRGEIGNTEIENRRKNIRALPGGNS